MDSEKTGGLAQDRIKRGEPILGRFNDESAYLMEWMGDIPDDKPIESLNIPGTHDAAAWKYTGPHNEWFNCQSVPLLTQLDSGVRFFDLRIGYYESKLVFYHAMALLSDTAEVEDIFWGFYEWLDRHPSEALFISLKVDNGPTDLNLQQTILRLLTEGRGRSYWSQLAGQLGTLGECRKKLSLLRRFDWSLVPTSSHIGIDLFQDWQHNSAFFPITYNQSTSSHLPNADQNSTQASSITPPISTLDQISSPVKIAYIEDHFLLEQETEVEKITTKFNAVIAHLDRARTMNLDQLHITFASGTSMGVSRQGEATTPIIVATGRGAVPGINQRLKDALKDSQRSGGRLGMIFIDFFDTELVELIIGAKTS
jgi:1-phosphatidylinositol phosphodiesterase